MHEPVNSLSINGTLQEDAIRRGDSGPLSLNILYLGEEFEKRDGSTGQDRLYVKAICWGDMRDEFEHLKEGDFIGVEGKVQFNGYTNADGVDVKSWQLVARDIQVLGKGEAPEPRAQEQTASTFTPADDDDIPF